MRTFIRSLRQRTFTRAFTLVELLVVIAIIAVLAALIIAAGTHMVADQEAKNTQNMLSLLDSAYTQWKSDSGRDITYGEDGVPSKKHTYELLEQDPVIFDAGIVGSEDVRPMIDQTRAFFAIVSRPSQIKEMLSQLSDDQMAEFRIPNNDPDGIPTIDLADAWGQPVLVVHPGRTWVSGFDPPDLRNEDGTILTPAEKVFGVAQNRRPYFVSGGPDTVFGALNTAKDDPVHEAAHDNIYSDEIEEPN